MNTKHIITGTFLNFYLKKIDFKIKIEIDEAVYLLTFELHAYSGYRKREVYI